MNEEMDIQAWKNPAYRRSLGADAPVHPSGAQYLEDGDLEGVSGAGTSKLTTHGCCKNPPMTIATACGTICIVTYFVCN